jgi:hypothetical protein
MRRISIAPSGPTHTMKGSAVVAIGVDRLCVGRDDGARLRVSGIIRNDRFSGLSENYYDPFSAARQVSAVQLFSAFRRACSVSGGEVGL